MTGGPDRKPWPAGGAIKTTEAERLAERRARANSVGGRARNEKRKAAAWSPTGEGIKRGW